MLPRALPLLLALVGLCPTLALFACGGGGSTGEPDASAGAAGQNTAGTGGSAGGTGNAGTSSDDILPLPLIVDFNFFPSGAFGRLIDVGPDGTEDTFAEGCDGDDLGEWDNVAIDQTDSACPTRPSAVTSDINLNLARCSAFVFTPAGLDAVDATTWAGVLWQNTTCNWGADPPTQVMAGASRVSFWAWSNAASVGASVVFQAGGIGQAGTPHRDTFTRTLTVTLTATPTQYELDLSAATYPNGVISAFGWTAERTDLSTLTFYVDGMRWK